MAKSHTIFSCQQCGATYRNWTGRCTKCGAWNSLIQQFDDSSRDEKSAVGRGHDLATLFTGRTFKIEVFPFSFREFLQYHELTDYRNAFSRYLKEGGMSGSYLYDDQASKYG